MIDRRRLVLFGVPVLAAAVPAVAADATPPVNCGDPGGRFISCDAARVDLPLQAWQRCPLCGGRHAAQPAP